MADFIFNNLNNFAEKIKSSKMKLTFANGAAESRQVVRVDARGAVGGAALEGAVLAVALGAAVVAPPAVSVHHVLSGLGVASFRRPAALRVAD
jgi:hypothetical protein